MPSHNMKQNISSLKSLIDTSHCSVDCRDSHQNSTSSSVARGEAGGGGGGGA